MDMQTGSELSMRNSTISVKKEQHSSPLKQYAVFSHYVLFKSFCNNVW